MNKKLILYGLGSALGEAVYVILVASFMRNANQFFGPNPTIFAMAAFLLIFVFSAAVSGALILGKPILLYMEGSKREALELFAITLGWMLVLLIILLAAVASF